MTMLGRLKAVDWEIMMQLGKALAFAGLISFGIWLLQPAGEKLDARGLSCLDSDDIERLEAKAKDQNPLIFERLHANYAVCGSQKEVEMIEREAVLYGNPRFLLSHANEVFTMAKDIQDPELSLRIMDLASLRVEQVIALSDSNMLGSEVRIEAENQLDQAKTLAAEIDVAERQLSEQIRLKQSPR